MKLAGKKFVVTGSVQQIDAFDGFIKEFYHVRFFFMRANN
jgi:hypothetical protein